MWREGRKKMSDPRVSNLAKILVHYSAEIKPGDDVLILVYPTMYSSMPLVEQVYREILRAGGHPCFYPIFQNLEFAYYMETNEQQLKWVDPFYSLAINEFDSFIHIMGAENTQYMNTVDPEKQRIWVKAYSEINLVGMRRQSTGELRRVTTLVPTSGYAQDAEMSVEAFENFVYSTTYADVDEPVRMWQSIHDSQKYLINWLSGKKTIEAKGPDVDLTLSVEGRRFINCDGKINMPDGEIYTGPIEDSANGWIRFSFPAIYMGRVVEGVELHFVDGKVENATAKKNEVFLHEMLNIDEGASYLGEFAFGTNKRIDRFIKNILFDEKIGGTIHFALGAGYPESGSKNESAIHWDMLCDMRDGGQVFVDGELFYDSGEFLVE
jgi:aminopeptidase